MTAKNELSAVTDRSVTWDHMVDELTGDVASVHAYVKTYLLPRDYMLKKHIIHLATKQASE